MTTETFRDSTLAIDVRVADLLSRMTLEEKAGQLTQYFHFGSLLADAPEGVDAGEEPNPFFASIRLPHVVEAEIAAGRAGSTLFVRDAAEANRIQRLAVENTRLGIPLLFGFDVIHGMRTIFPVPIALAATWDPDTIAAAQAVAAREARAHGIHWTFAPMVDIARDPRWGRIVEGAGEDPYLASAVAAAQVRGFQGPGDTLGHENVLAGPKHLAGYGAAVGGRDYEEAEISDSELWNVYLPPFKAAIDAGAGSIMSAYMELNGVPATGNRWLLTDVLREAWGFDGFVVSDANAVHSLEIQHFAASQAHAGSRALTAGLDMEMTMFEPAFGTLPDAVAEGRVDVAVLDAAVSRVLAAKFRLGLFEEPFVDEAAALEVLGAPEHGEAARRAAEESLVLLKNDGILPLDRTTVRSIAVVGQLAASKRDTLGPWVFDHVTADAVPILDALNHAVGPDLTVAYAPGAGIPERLHPSFFDAADATMDRTPADYDDDAAIAEAVQLAGASDVAVVVVGERQIQAGELASRSTLELAGRQLEQLQEIVATGTPVVLLVMSTRPLDLRWASENVSAIIDVWYPGQRGGEAVASAIVGEVSPAGRLPFTWPRHVGQVPLYYSKMTTFQPENADTRYWDDPSTPLYPFGFGLSYARFAYANLRLDRDTIGVGESATVSVDVTNTSHVDADEVVQLYIHQRHGSAARPARELKGFRRVRIEAGETVTVEFPLGPDQLTYWSAATRDWVHEATELDVWAGADSTATLATVLRVSA